MNTAINFARELQTMKATDVIRDERVKTQFINIYNSIWKEGGEAAYEREAIYFNQQLREKPGLRECSGTSIFYSFIDLAVRGLTLLPGTQALCYLIPRSAKVGVDEKGKDVWEKVCNLTISGYGELILRRKAGQILHADNPTIVYEGDTFQFGEKDGHKIVNYMSCFPRRSNKIVACFMKITRVDGSVDYSVMTENDWLRLKSYSDKQNTFFDRKTNQYVTRPNELYNKDGQIDTGFLMAKCIKHAFKTYPKLQIGRGTSLESDMTEQPVYDIVPQISEGTTSKPQESFAEPKDTSEGVTISTDENSDDIF